MTMKDIFFGLTRAGTNLLSGIGSAAVEVLRQGDSEKPEESDLEQYGRETAEYGYESTRWWSVPEGSEHDSR